MSELACSIYPPRKWYNSDIFPLIPIVRVRQPNEYNTKSVSFHWLFIQLWTLDSLALEVSFVINEHWGIGFLGIIPYLRWVIAIPFPLKFQRWIQSTLWRKPAKQKT